jgi:DTW domain-containing protein YfiP
LFNLPFCLCAELPVVRTEVEIVIVRHVAELRLTSNTGRLAALSLTNVKVLDYGGGEAFDESALDPEGAWLLYNSAASPVARESPPRAKRLFVLDGSFRQARRMYKRLESLHSVPELALSPPAIAPLRLRQPPHPAGMSTLEAIAHAIALLESPALAEPLHRLQREFVRRMDALRGRQRDAEGRAIS